MTETAPLIIAGIIAAASVVAVLITLGSAAIWVGALKGRIDRLEKDVAKLATDEARTTGWLNDHFGYHRGRGDVQSDRPTDQSRN